MRRLVPFLALSMLLSGCGAAGAGAPGNFEQAMDAYVAGDRTALHEAGESGRAVKAKLSDKTSMSNICETLSPDERREVFPALIIDMLDKPTLMSMSESARYLYFRSISRRFEDMQSLVSSVDGGCGGVTGALGDISTLTSMRKVVMDRETIWRRKLEAEYGAQLTPRLDEARKLLARNGYASGALSVY
jgi:hypothetical protein